MKPAKVVAGKVPLVEVRWRDARAFGTDNWCDHPDLDPATSVAVGYLISETETAVTLVALANVTHYGHGITIPRGCITAITHR